MQAGTYPARGYATLELSGLELSFTGACVRASFYQIGRDQPQRLTYQHRTGLSSYTSHFWFAGACVFAKQSVEKLLLWPSNGGQSILTSLRSAFLPSSLNHHHPSALVYSTCSPVSVCGTDANITPKRIFSRKLKSSASPTIMVELY